MTDPNRERLAQAAKSPDSLLTAMQDLVNTLPADTLIGLLLLALEDASGKTKERVQTNIVKKIEEKIHAYPSAENKDELIQEIIALLESLDSAYWVNEMMNLATDKVGISPKDDLLLALNWLRSDMFNALAAE